MTQATFLNPGNLGLTELPEELWELDHLQRLNVGDGYIEEGNWKRSQNKGPTNKIRKISSRIGKLTNLTSLSLRSNQIQDYSFLSGLTNLAWISAKIRSRFSPNLF